MKRFFSVLCALLLCVPAPIAVSAEVADDLFTDKDLTLADPSGAVDIVLTEGGVDNTEPGVYRLSGQIADGSIRVAPATEGDVWLLLVLHFVHPFSQPLLLRVTIPEDLDYTGVFDDLFATHTRRWRLEGVKTTGMGSLFELRYTVVLKDPRQEKAFLDELRCRNGNLTLSLTRNAPIHEEL